MNYLGDPSYRVSVLDKDTTSSAARGCSAVFILTRFSR